MDKEIKKRKEIDIEKRRTERKERRKVVGEMKCVKTGKENQ